MSSRTVWSLLCAASFVAVPGFVQVASAQVTRAWVATHDDGSPTALAVDGDGNVVVTGFAMSSGMESELATVKYSSDGAQLWDRRCGGEAPRGLAIDSAGNVLVTGTVAGDPDIDYVTAKYSHDGTELWVRRYDGPGHIDDFPTGIAVDASGNAFVTGLSLPPPGTGPAELATVKYDPEGSEVWVRRYPGAGDVTDQRRWLAVDGAGNVYVAGTFVESIDWGQGSCCHVGLLAGLECANQSEAQRKVLIYVGNGGGTCTGSDEPEYLEETLAAVTSLNTHGVEIHCIGIVSPSTQGRHFMHRLAWDNGGSYTEIVR